MDISRSEHTELRVSTRASAPEESANRTVRSTGKKASSTRQRKGPAGPEPRSRSAARGATLEEARPADEMPRPPEKPARGGKGPAAAPASPAQPVTSAPPPPPPQPAGLVEMLQARWPGWRARLLADRRLILGVLSGFLAGIALFALLSGEEAQPPPPTPVPASPAPIQPYGPGPAAGGAAQSYWTGPSAPPPTQSLGLWPPGDGSMATPPGAGWPMQTAPSPYARPGYPAGAPPPAAGGWGADAYRGYGSGTPPGTMEPPVERPWGNYRFER